MNKNYYNTLDENFNEAFKLIDANLTHNELIELLKNGNIPQKQIAAIRLDTLKSIFDADVLISNLTGQDGKIREVVSLKIKEFLSNPQTKDFFLSTDIDLLSSKFIDALTDINGNICRNIIEALIYLENCQQFVDLFNKKLIYLINQLLDKIKDFDLQEGKYKINKEVFKLYWCLEAVNIYFNKISTTDLKEILNVTKSIQDYTIREKTAKILTHELFDKDLIKIRNELKNDSNYYVRRF